MFAPIISTFVCAERRSMEYKMTKTSRGASMKTGIATAVLSACLFSIPAAKAQTPAAPPPPVVTANPVMWSANQIYTRQEKYIIDSGEAMPADKYSFHPTPDQKSFGWIMSHLAASNGGICAILADGKAPDTTKVAETASKAELQAALKASFDYCDPIMAGLTDAKLGDTVTFFRGAKVPRARAVIEITGDLMDHYSQMAMYLRLNGVLPPSATPKKP
jgi:hypothetical protein